MVGEKNGKVNIIQKPVKMRSIFCTLLFGYTITCCVRYTVSYHVNYPNTEESSLYNNENGDIKRTVLIDKYATNIEYGETLSPNRDYNEETSEQILKKIRPKKKKDPTKYEGRYGTIRSVKELNKLRKASRPQLDLTTEGDEYDEFAVINDDDANDIYKDQLLSELRKENLAKKRRRERKRKRKKASKRRRRGENFDKLPKTHKEKDVLNDGSQQIDEQTMNLKNDSDEEVLQAIADNNKAAAARDAIAIEEKTASDDTDDNGDDYHIDEDDYADALNVSAASTEQPPTTTPSANTTTPSSEFPELDQNPINKEINVNDVDVLAEDLEDDIPNVAQAVESTQHGDELDEIAVHDEKKDDDNSKDALLWLLHAEDSEKNKQKKETNRKRRGKDSDDIGLRNAKRLQTLEPDREGVDDIVKIVDDSKLKESGETGEEHVSYIERVKEKGDDKVIDETLASHEITKTGNVKSVDEKTPTDGSVDEDDDDESSTVDDDDEHTSVAYIEDDDDIEDDNDGDENKPKVGDNESVSNASSSVMEKTVTTESTIFELKQNPVDKEINGNEEALDADLKDTDNKEESGDAKEDDLDDVFYDKILKKNFNSFLINAEKSQRPNKTYDLDRITEGFLPEDEDYDQIDLPDLNVTGTVISIEEKDNYEIKETPGSTIRKRSVEEFDDVEDENADDDAEEDGDKDDEDELRNKEIDLRDKPNGPIALEEQETRQFSDLFATNPRAIKWKEPGMLSNCWFHAMVSKKHRFSPSCNADGTYSPKQCLLQRCWCVNKDGTPEVEEDNERFFFAMAGLMLKCTQNV